MASDLLVTYGLRDQGDHAINQYLLIISICGVILNFIACLEFGISAVVEPFPSSFGYD